MTDLTDDLTARLTDEKIAELAAGGGATRHGNIYLQMMAVEIRRHRAARAADREKIWEAVFNAAAEHPASPAITIADRAADALASPLPALTAERVRSVVDDAVSAEMGRHDNESIQDADWSEIRHAIADRVAEQLAGAAVYAIDPELDKRAEDALRARATRRPPRKLDSDRTELSDLRAMKVRLEEWADGLELIPEPLWGVTAARLRDIMKGTP